MRRLQALWNWLVRPAPHIKQPDQRRQAHLLAAMLLIIVPMGLTLPLLLSLDAAARAMIGGPELALVTGIGLFAIIPYWLNRQGHTRLAARLTVYFVALAIYLVALTPTNPQGIDSLIRLMLPIIVGVIMLPLYELMLLVVVIIAATLAYPMFVTHTDMMTVLTGPLVFLAVGSALIIIFAHHRSRIEADRRAHLSALEARYRHIFEASFDTIMIHRDGRLVDANHNFAEFFGLPPHAGLLLTELVLEPAVVEPDSQISQALLKRLDGSTFFAEMVTIDQIHEGQLAQVTALRDVSRARRVENALRESERRFRTVADSSPDFIYIWEEGVERLPYFNHDGFLGYTREELVVPGYLASVTHLDDWSLLHAHWQSVLNGTTTAPLEYRARHKQGHWEWLERWATILARYADDQPIQILVTMRVITERKQAAERFQVLYDNTPVMMHSVDQDGRIVAVNNHWLRVTGYTRQEVMGRRPLDFFTPESRRFAVEQALPDFFDADFAENIAFQLVKKNGDIMDVSWTATSERDADGQMLSALTFMTDITERERAMAQLRQSEARFRAIWENATDVITLTDPDGIIVEVNPAVETVFGYPVEAVVNQPFDHFRAGADHEAALELYRQTFHIIEAGTVFENEIKDHDGSTRVIETRISFLSDKGQRTALLSINRDITERKQADEDLRRSARENRALLDAIPDLIIRLNADGCYLQVWPSKKPLDYRPVITAEELVGKCVTDIFPQDTAGPMLQIIRAVLADGEMRQHEYRLLEHGVWRYYDASWVRYNANEVLATVRDVTDRRQDEARLRREANIFQNLVEAIIVTEYIGGEFRVQTVNRAAEEMYGWQRSEALGQLYVELVKPIYPDDETPLNIKNILLQTGHWKDEVVHHRRDGRQLNVLSSVTLLRDDSGEPTGSVTIALDITRRKQAERDLYLTESRLQSALKTASIVVSNQDVDLRYTWIHMPAHDFDSSRIIGKRDADLLERAENAAMLSKLKRQVLTSGSGLRREVQIWERGEERAYDLSIEPLCDEAGRVVGITCVQVDITERVQTEQARQKIQRLMQTVISNMPIIVWAVDQDGTITLSEGMGLRRVNREPGGMVGESIFVRYADDPDLLNNMRRGLAGDAFTAFHETDGIQYQTHFHPAFNQSGRVVGLLGVTIDLTERANIEAHRLQLALERERIELMQRFVGDVSHDFRTPLTSIKLSAHLLGKVQYDEDRLRHIDVIERQTQRLERLMGDLFNLSRLDTASTNEFDFGSVDFNAMLTDIIAAHQVYVQEHGHTLIFEPDPELPDSFGDRLQLDRVFTNLLTNAVNYTPEAGTITIRTRQQERHLVIEFSDTGIGIAPEKLELIFNRFYRADPARGTDAGGMGVGLAIARKVIEAHGGKIEVESMPEAGSTFRVMLPHIRSTNE